ncbi:hypothetical protein [Deinococcus aluminii]|uniref:Histidine phosphatase family protein n=1 Tax=Deinococcus aluminii TaxID=1656885 RepID=A0ABP9XBF5_9DEIO
MTSFPQSITVIRHGEKPTGAKDSASGVNERGEARPDSLTPRGWQRAGALAALLGAERVLAPFTRPTVLYACGYHGDPAGQHHRPRETITPLSWRLGLDIHAPLLKTEGAALATEHMLKDAGQEVLVCWEHHNIPPMVAALAEALGVSQIPAAGRQWPDSDFSSALIFSRAGDGFELRQVSQGVLDGD